MVYPASERNTQYNQQTVNQYEIPEKIKNILQVNTAQKMLCAVSRNPKSENQNKSKNQNIIRDKEDKRLFTRPMS